MAFKINSFRSVLLITLFITQLILIVGCGQGRGFALPTGELEAGKTAFTKFGCNNCHSVGDIEFKGLDENLKVPLGGAVTMVKTYGELVTSIINPAHKIDKNNQLVDGFKMKTYNEVMTVQELVDIVTFLQSEYEIKTPSHYSYPY
jgi:hypothetical protein